MIKKHGTQAFNQGLYTFAIVQDEVDAHIPEGAVMELVIEGGEEKVKLATGAKGAQFAGIAKHRNGRNFFLNAKEVVTANADGTIMLSRKANLAQIRITWLDKTDGKVKAVPHADVVAAVDPTGYIFSLGATHKEAVHTVVYEYAPTVEESNLISGQDYHAGALTRSGVVACFKHGHHRIATSVFDASADWTLEEGKPPVALYAMNNGKITTTPTDMPVPLVLVSPPSNGVDSTITVRFVQQ